MSKIRFIKICLVASWLITGMFNVPYADLISYVSKPDPSYAYQVVDTKVLDGCPVKVVRLTSQTWQGIEWNHWLVILCPEGAKQSDIALLVIGGGSNRQTEPKLDSTEAKVATMVAQRTQSVIALLFQVPNQPLFDGRNEDEIIAYTYDKYLNGEGDEWPLLLPMVKSAIRAMDTIQAVQKEYDQQEIKRFVLTGGSKRGWTTWLSSATGDPRIVAIAPVVIDVLNMREQMLHQLKCYGTFSSEIEDYTRLKIPQRMNSPKGYELLRIVDPYSYREKLSLPKLVILGTNDPYWTVDSANIYIHGFPGPLYVCYQPNTGHDINPIGVSTLAEFFLSIKNNTPFYKMTWQSKKNSLVVEWDNPNGVAYLWKADSPNRDFRNSKWESVELEGKQKAKAKFKKPSSGWSAYFVEVRFPGGFGYPVSLCTGMTVLPHDEFPFDVDEQNVQAIPRSK